MTFTTEIAGNSDNLSTGSTRPGGLKPLFVRGLLLCLSGTAAIGIYALFAGTFNATGVRVLLSTLLVGLYCLLCLADLSVLGTRFRAVGAAGISAATTALAQGLFLIWAVREDFWSDTWILVARGFLLAAILAFALAHAALLLRIELHGSGSVAALRAATLTLVGMVALLLCAPLVETGLAESAGYWRIVGALAILDALGTVCLPVLARFETRNDERSAR